MWQEFDLTLWYRPIEAIKFGLQYSYEPHRLACRSSITRSISALHEWRQASLPSNNAGAKDVGEAHRIQFVAFMFF